MEGADFSQRCPISVPLRSQRSPGLSHRVFSIWDFCLPFEAAPRIYSFLRQLFRCTAPHNVPRDNKPGSAVSLVSQNVDAVLFSGNSHAPPPSTALRPSPHQYVCRRPPLSLRGSASAPTASCLAQRSCCCRSFWPEYFLCTMRATAYYEVPHLSRSTP